MQELNLSNGLKLIFYPVKYAKSIEMGLYIKAGSRYEIKENNGITHLLEHMHFRQLGSMPQEEIFMSAECIGSSLYGITHKEMMHFNMKIRPKYLMECLLFFENILNTFDWSKEQFENEKKVVLNELREKEDTIFLQTISDKALWQNHSLAQQILGNKDIIDNLSLEDLVNYKKDIFCKENIALIITGAIEDKDIQEVVQKIEDIQIGDNKRNIADETASAQFIRKSNIVLEKIPSWKFLDIQLSFDIDMRLIDENELLFLNSIIGGGDGSVIQKEIRDNMGLVYDIYSQVEIHNDVAVLTILFSIEKKKLHIALEKIAHILKNLKTNIHQKEIDMNKVFFTDNLWYWEEDLHELNLQLGYDFIKGNKLLTIEERINANDKIDYMRMREISSIIFKEGNMSIVAMGPISSATKKIIKEALYNEFL